MTLPTDAAERKALPLFSGVLAYFPDALAAVAELSAKGNDQHNPGEPLYWARSKSGDEADALVRHLLEHGTVDTDGIRHSAKVAWRALALLQKELEAAGAPLARGARLPA
ncbi:dATP/dGTP diphosphohydrolase domain-containing protein [Lysobacter sp. HA35]